MQLYIVRTEQIIQTTILAYQRNNNRRDRKNWSFKSSKRKQETLNALHIPLAEINDAVKRKQETLNDNIFYLTEIINAITIFLEKKKSASSCPDRDEPRQCISDH